jgi:hypothetical protein
MPGDAEARARLDSRSVEPLIVLVVTLALAVGLGLPTLWLVVPFLWITITGRSYEEYGLQIGEIGSLRLHATLVLVIFGGYAAIHYAFTRFAFGARFEPTLNPDFLNLLLTHLIVIGLSEEVFFRGYLQTEMNRSFGRPYEIWGARVGWGLVAASLLFGLCHVVHGDLTRVRVAFFGLFAGWLRERTGGVAVPAVYHGVANVLYDFMQRSMVA